MRKIGFGSFFLLFTIAGLCIFAFENCGKDSGFAVANFSVTNLNNTATFTPPVSGTPYADGVVPTTDAHIFLTPENWIQNVDGTVETNCPGAYLKFGFSGTSLKILLDPGTQDIHLAYTIDSGPSQVIAISAGSPGTVTIATGLSRGQHQVRIVADELGFTDRWVKVVDRLKIKNFFIDANEQITDPVLKSKRIVVYGDSISEGVVSALPAETSWSTSWDARLADMLDAEVSAVTFQAQGYEHPGQGMVPGFVSAYPFIRQGVARQFSKPDFIFILHGTNGGTQSDAALMMVNLRKVYPAALIAQVVPFGGYLRNEITNAFNDQQDSHIALFDLGSAAQTIVAKNSSDTIHPNPEGQRQLAEMLYGNFMAYLASKNK